MSGLTKTVLDVVHDRVDLTLVGRRGDHEAIGDVELIGDVEDHYVAGQFVVGCERGDTRHFGGFGCCSHLGVLPLVWFGFAVVALVTGPSGCFFWGAGSDMVTDPSRRSAPRGL